MDRIPSPDDATEVGPPPAGVLARERDVAGIARAFPGFVIERELASGGMGVVYRAMQIDPDRPVALKIVRPDLASPEVLRRFQFEARVLGLLNHPGIARIYDAGTFDAGCGPQPFFAMEYVEGLPLIRYAQEAGLDARRRADLMIKVCEAVHHAHQKGVVHRDLKPGNILVDETGQPKVLDFGLARAVDRAAANDEHRTEVGRVLGTYRYMSPEQAAGDLDAIDVRCDVYSLGVIAYELFTGNPPYEFGEGTDPLHVIRNVDPRRMTVHDRALRGDLETIVRTALEKDKERRYPSAWALGDEFRRWLNDEPIEAHPPSFFYQLAKFARRNRAFVAGTLAVVVASAVGGGAAVNQARKAEHQAETVIQVLDFLTKMFEQAEGKPPLRERTALEILEKARGDAPVEFAEQPEVLARVLYRLGMIYDNLDKYEIAHDLLERAVRARKDVFGPRSREAAEALAAFGESLGNAGRDAEAREALLEALSIFESLPKAEDALAEVRKRLDAAGNGLDSTAPAPETSEKSGGAGR